MDWTIPIFTTVLAVLPFLFFPTLRKKDQEIKSSLLYFCIFYFIILALLALCFVGLQAMQVMYTDNIDRSLFVSALLVVACIDQLTYLLPAAKIMQVNLAFRLLYFVLLINAIPAVWQTMENTIPVTISNQPSALVSLQIMLVILMVGLSLANWSFKKK